MLTKTFHRQQYNYQKRELERLFDLIGLSQSQQQQIRYIIDTLIEEQRKELIAPEDGEGK